MLSLSVRTVIRVAWVTTATLILVHVLLRFLFLPDIPGIYILRAAVDLDAEQSISTWMSSILWGSAALAAFLVGRGEAPTSPRRARWWYAFALVPLAVSVDEVAAVHEKLSEPLRSQFDLDGVLFFAWVLPVGLLAVLLAVVFLRFIWALPPWLRNRIVVAAGLSVIGAIGVELIGSAIWRSETLGRNSAEYILVTTIEETLELAGALVLFDAVLRYLSERTDSLSLRR